MTTSDGTVTAVNGVTVPIDDSYQNFVASIGMGNG